MAGAKKAGKKTDRKVKLFALSTCIWCRKTKDLLDDLGVDYECTDVDLLNGAERDEATAEMKRHNPRGSYPTLICGDDVVVGYDDRKIKNALGIDD